MHAKRDGIGAQKTNKCRFFPVRNWPICQCGAAQQPAPPLPAARRPHHAGTPPTAAPACSSRTAGRWSRALGLRWASPAAGGIAPRAPLAMPRGHAAVGASACSSRTLGWWSRAPGQRHARHGSPATPSRPAASAGPSLQLGCLIPMGSGHGCGQASVQQAAAGQGTSGSAASNCECHHHEPLGKARFRPVPTGRVVTCRLVD